MTGRRPHSFFNVSSTNSYPKSRPSRCRPSLSSLHQCFGSVSAETPTTVFPKRIPNDSTFRITPPLSSDSGLITPPPPPPPPHNAPRKGLQYPQSCHSTSLLFSLLSIWACNPTPSSFLGKIPRYFFVPLRMSAPCDFPLHQRFCHAFFSFFPPPVIKLGPSAVITVTIARVRCI